jgi:hypothetical protein
VNPPAIERAGPETPHLQWGALDLYPNRRHHSKPDPRLDPTRPLAGIGRWNEFVERAERVLRNDLMDELFRRMAKADVRSELIAAKLNRSRHTIKPRAYAIGLPRKWLELKAKGK